MRSNTTTVYEPIVISDMTSISFRKENAMSDLSVFGYIYKNGAEIGLVSYKQSSDFLGTNIKKMSELTKEEINIIYQKVPVCIADILNESVAIDNPELPAKTDALESKTV